MMKKAMNMNKNGMICNAWKIEMREQDIPENAAQDNVTLLYKALSIAKESTEI
jgi:hypothetical protein